MICKSTIYVVTVLFFVLAPVPLSAQSAAEKCEVPITEPQPGQSVRLNGMVRGAATLPFDHHLWTFVRPVLNFATLDLWWPQGEAKVDTAGRWELPATFGRPQHNLGEQFDVTAGVFAPQQHAQLVDYLREAMRTGIWDAIEMPTAACVAGTVTVRKVGD